MEHITVEKAYEQYKDVSVIENLTKNLVASMSEDMKLCIMARVPIDCTVEASKDGQTMIFKAKTKYPVSILKDQYGRVLDILIKK